MKPVDGIGHNRRWLPPSNWHKRRHCRKPAHLYCARIGGRTGGKRTHVGCAWQTLPMARPLWCCWHACTTFMLLVSANGCAHITPAHSVVPGLSTLPVVSCVDLYLYMCLVCLVICSDKAPLICMREQHESPALASFSGRRGKRLVGDKRTKGCGFSFSQKTGIRPRLLQVHSKRNSHRCKLIPKTITTIDTLLLQSTMEMVITG
jgi:putative hemolysin